VEQIYATIGRQRHGKIVSTATGIDATMEDAVFSLLSVPMLYKEDQLNSQLVDSQLEVEVGGW
jgi:hypothetical protein